MNIDKLVSTVGSTTITNIFTTRQIPREGKIETSNNYSGLS